MNGSRRNCIRQLAGISGLLIWSGIAAPQMTPTARPMPSPNAPDPHAPAGLERPPMASGKTKLNPDKARQLRSDVDKLYQMTLELKNEVDSTDLNAVLPIDLMKRTEQIEKLAKHVKDEAKS